MNHDGQIDYIRFALCALVSVLGTLTIIFGIGSLVLPEVHDDKLSQASVGQAASATAEAVSKMSQEVSVDQVVGTVADPSGLNLYQVDLKVCGVNKDGQPLIKAVLVPSAGCTVLSCKVTAHSGGRSHYTIEVVQDNRIFLAVLSEEELSSHYGPPKAIEYPAPSP